MPRIVDAEERREQVTAAAIKLLSEGGFASLSLSRLAKELGGSMRLVTHYFRDRQELLSAILEDGREDTERLISEIEGIPEPRARLRRTMEWFLVQNERDMQLEKTRVALVVHKDLEPSINDFFAAVELEMRRALRAAVVALVPDEEVESLVDLLRAWASGLALVSVEHPEIWTPAKQRRVLDDFLTRIGLN